MGHLAKPALVAVFGETRAIHILLLSTAMSPKNLLTEKSSMAMPAKTYDRTRMPINS